METLAFRTVPTVRVDGYTYSSALHPYRRVVGVGTNAQMLWSKNQYVRKENKYKKRHTEVEALEVPDLFARGVVDFFRRYMTDLYRNDWYNCHHFARWVGKVSSEDYLGLKTPEAETILEEGEVVDGNNLALGTHGVMGIRGGDGLLHSVIGLGKDRGDCLQVLCERGFMGLDSYQNALNYYRKYYGDEVELYTSLTI